MSSIVPGIRRLVFNADDFGLDPAVNEAVESGFCNGVLTSASLMPGAPAAADAVQRARKLPGLAVGLHLTLVDGSPVLPPDRVPALVGSDGRFAPDLWKRSFRYFFLPQVRRQLEDEIRAQYAAFSDTGLHLDHANAHKHLHLHPTVLDLMLRVGREHGLRAVRVPREPVSLARKIAPMAWSAVVGAGMLSPWIGRMARRIRGYGLFSNDLLLGLQATGRMDLPRVLRILALLPPGSTTEIYFHPAVEQTSFLRQLMPDYSPVAEWQALCSPELRAALEKQDIEVGSYSDFSRR